MEPSRPIFARDIFEILASLLSWSSATFQTFLESGVLSDIKEAVMAGKRGKVDIKAREMMRFPRKCGDVTFPQAMRLLQIVPEGEVAKHFIYALNHWARTSGWWEKNKPDWRMRDDWREEMGLGKIHPIINAPNRGFETENMVDYVFRRVGHSTVQSLLLPGYRYAEPGEIPTYGFMLANKEGLYVVAWLDNHKSFATAEVHQTVLIPDMVTFSHENVFFMVQTKE